MSSLLAEVAAARATATSDDVVTTAIDRDRERRRQQPNDLVRRDLSTTEHWLCLTCIEAMVETFTVVVSYRVVAMVDTC